MGKSRFTKWFKHKIKPALRGVYQTDASNQYQAFQHWDGKVWGCFAATIERASSYEGDPSMFQDVKWRGLAEKP